MHFIHVWTILKKRNKFWLEQFNAEASSHISYLLERIKYSDRELWDKVGHE